jgi:hypothetical protein
MKAIESASLANSARTWRQIPFRTQRENLVYTLFHDP